jgi:uncharacterized membrane protein
MTPTLDPLVFFALAFGITAMAGLAVLLKSTLVLTCRNIVGCILHTGAMGVGIAMLGYSFWGTWTWYILGLNILVGLGGVSLFKFISAVFAQGGVNIRINLPTDVDKEDA